MIPTSNTILNTEFEIKQAPSLNYKMHFKENVINGLCDEREAMEQVIYKIINTERYQHVIYSWNYGIELADLFGEAIAYVCLELERRITEALMQDDRVTAVDSFLFTVSKKTVVHVAFVLHTIFGEIEAEKEVSI